MRYSVQHNGKGKQHLIPEHSDRELCGTHGIFLFTNAATLEYKRGKWYEIFVDLETEINEAILDCYCKKCIKRALNENAGL